MTDQKTQKHAVARSLSTAGLGGTKASELLLQSAEPFDQACMMVREMELEIDRLRELVKEMQHFVPHNQDGIDCQGCAMDARIAALTPNDRVEGRDAASSRRVPSHDGLCGNGNYNERTDK